MRPAIIIAAILFSTTSIFATEKVVEINLDKTEKNLSHCYLGANAQQFRSHYSIKKMLDNEELFSQFLFDIGSPVLRMDGRSTYGWFSKREYLQLKRALSARSKLKHKIGKEEKIELDSLSQEEYEQLLKKYNIDPSKIEVKMNNPDVAWFNPGKFHNFCKKHNIRLIGAISDTQFYDPAIDKVIMFRNKPQYFDSAVAANMRKLSWIIKHGYKDLYVAWEIGNESFISWDPVLYAQYAGKIIDAAKKLQPNIKLSVPAILRDTDDPFIKQFIKRLKARGSKNDWFSWHEKMIPALGKKIKEISYVAIHVYGAESRYNANAKGLDLATGIDFPDTSHLRYIVTEWRYTGRGGSKHRTYAMGALWNTKFAMDLLSHPQIDYSTIHEFLCTSGLGYWTPGKGNDGASNKGDEWVFQYQENQKYNKKFQLRSKHGKPAFDIGPFGPPNKMLNELIRDCPLLLTHESGSGKNSSALYADGLDFTNKKAGKSDIDAIITTNKSRSKIGGVIVNTFSTPVKLKLSLDRKNYILTEIRQMTCAPAQMFNAEVPGAQKFWQVKQVAPKGKTITLPPYSITDFRADLR